MDDVGCLAADLGRFLDELPVELGVAQARAVRRERLEQYVDGMSTARRLRLAGALHLLSRRLDEDLAHSDQREAAPGASPAPSQPGDPRATAPRVTASTTKRRSVTDPRIAIAAKR
jgi:hypothetical protein